MKNPITIPRIEVLPQEASQVNLVAAFPKAITFQVVAEKQDLAKTLAKLWQDFGK